MSVQIYPTALFTLILPPSKKRKAKDNAGFRTLVKRLEDELTRAISDNAPPNPWTDLPHDCRARYEHFKSNLCIVHADKKNTTATLMVISRGFYSATQRTSRPGFPRP